MAARRFPSSTSVDFTQVIFQKIGRQISVVVSARHEEDALTPERANEQPGLE